MEDKSLTRLPDEELMLRCRLGDTEGFTELFERYKKPIINFAWSFVGDYEEAKDIFQETFMRIFKHAGSYRYPEKFPTWLYKVARNLCIDTLRKKSRRPTISMEAELADDSKRPDEEAEEKESNLRLMEAIDSLPEKYREVVIMRGLQRLSGKEIAGILGCSEGAARFRVYYALKLLRTVFVGKG